MRDSLGLNENDEANRNKHKDVSRLQFTPNEEIKGNFQPSNFVGRSNDVEMTVNEPVPQSE